MKIINYFYPKKLSVPTHRNFKKTSGGEPKNFFITQQTSAWLTENGDKKMIEVTKLNDEKMVINADLIETVDETPDTVITLSTGRKIIVKESRQEVRNLVILYKKECYEDLGKLLLSEQGKQSGNDKDR